MQKKTYRLALIGTVASLFLCSVPLFASETDNRIEASAQESYVFRTYLKGDDIKVQSKDGFVTLTGTVSDADHKVLAKETVWNLAGVKDVNNKLEYGKEAPAVSTDPWLVAKVKSTLLFHGNVSGTQTEVSAENGTIILRGEAMNTAQKDLTSEYAKDIEGVKGVRNEMTVASSGQKSDTTVGRRMDTMGERIDDASISALVKTTLLSHRSTSALLTSVETKDGMVKLGGKAKNAAEKDLASKIVADVPGVKSVSNTMTIEEPKSRKKGAVEGC